MNPEITDALNAIAPTIVSYAVRIAGVLVLVWLAFRIASRLGTVATARLQSRGIEQTLAIFTGSLVRWAVVTCTLVACLGVFGVETTSFAAVIGAAGLAIGLAFQGTLSNLAAGVMLLVFRPFKVGDVVTVSGQTGAVVEIGLFVTLLDTPDNRRIIVPNKRIDGDLITNVSYHERRRVDIPVGVDYSASVETTRKVLESIIAELPDTEKDTSQVVLIDLGDSAVNWQLRIWCQAGDFWAVKERATNNLKTALDAAGIGIPYPQMDVHLDSPPKAA